MAKGLGKNAPEKGALVASVDAEHAGREGGRQAGRRHRRGQRQDRRRLEGRAAHDPRRQGRPEGRPDGVARRADACTCRRRRRSCRATAASPRAAARAAAAQRQRASKAKLGIGLSSMTPGLAERIGIDPKMKGAVITSVRDGSPAQEAGLQQGDVIVEVDRKPVQSADDAVKTLGGRSLRRSPRARASRRRGAVRRSSPPRNHGSSRHKREARAARWHAPRFLLSREEDQPCVRKVGCSRRRSW